MLVHKTLSKDQINKYKDNCLTILSISPKIRYVGIINNFGQTLAGQLRKGVVPLLKPDDSRNEHFIEATRNRLRKEFEGSIGKTIYTFTENEKIFSLFNCVRYSGFHSCNYNCCQPQTSEKNGRTNYT